MALVQLINSRYAFFIRTLVMHCSRGTIQVSLKSNISPWIYRDSYWDLTHVSFVLLLCVIGYLVPIFSTDLNSHNYYRCDKFSSRVISCEENILRSLYLVSIVSYELKSLSLDVTVKAWVKLYLKIVLPLATCIATLIDTSKGTYSTLVKAQLYGSRYRTLIVVVKHRSPLSKGTPH